MDRSTVDRLVVEHLPVALRFALRLTGDSHQAEDVVQEALCRVLRRFRSYRKEASFKTWLLTIVLNVDRDRRRQRRPITPLPPEEPVGTTMDPYQHAVAQEQQSNLRAAIDRLPDRQREVAILSLGEGLPTDETAQILGISEANVHACIHLARKRIAQAVGFKYARRESK